MASDAQSYSEEQFSCSDGYAFHYRRYLPEGEPRAEIVYLHGIQSHAGWYEHSCHRLSGAGFGVSFLDRRGSGMNQANRGDATRFSRLVDEVEEYIFTLGRKPVYLLAVSWGGKLAVALQKRHPGLVKAMALMCPGFCPQIRPPLGQRLAILWARLTAPTRLFPIPLNDPELFTTNPRWLEFLRNDPLALHQATARLLIESVRLDAYLRFTVKFVQVPVLLMLAGQDRIIDNNRTRRFVEQFATADKTIIEYPDAHHTLEFETDPDPIIADLVSWLEKQDFAGNRS